MVGVCVLFAEFPFTAVELSSLVALAFCEDAVAGVFSVLGFGDSAGFGLSTFFGLFGLDLPVAAVVVLFGLDASAGFLSVSSVFEISTFFGLALLVAIVKVVLGESKISIEKMSTVRID